jgi:hypothetical protein
MTKMIIKRKLLNIFIAMMKKKIVLMNKNQKIYIINHKMNYKSMILKKILLIKIMAIKRKKLLAVNTHKERKKIIIKKKM